jgi:hypothetical protein
MPFELPLHRTDSDALDALRRELTSQTIERVLYYALEYPPWPEGRRLDSVHEAETGVQLVLESGVLFDVVWTQRGAYEGLSAELRDPLGPSPSISLPTDVSGTREWFPFIGRSFRLVSCLWTEAVPEAPEVLLALRLDNGSSAVFVTLGEDSNGSLTYHPDAVVAVFDEGEAMRYLNSLYNSGWN